MSRLRRAFSIAELIVVVIFIGTLAMISIPRINFAIISKQKAHTTAEKIATDLRRARRLAIADAAGNSKGFSLRMKGSKSYDGYEIVNLKSKVVVDSHQIDPQVVCRGDKEFKFGPLGNPENKSGKKLKVSSQGRSFTITVVPATGMVKCVED